MTGDLEKPIVAEGYSEFLQDLKARIRQAQVRAALSVNRELVLLYWGIGREILQRQQMAGWGAKVIDRLAKDLRSEFPEMKGLSPRNLKYMRALAEAYPDEQFVQQLVAQIPWGHNVRVLDHVKDPGEREWYIRQTSENGWSRNVLVLQIESGLYQRQGKAVTNFAQTLPAPQSDLAQQLLKDPSRTRQYPTRQYGDRSVSAYTSRHLGVLCPSPAPGRGDGCRLGLKNPPPAVDGIRGWFLARARRGLGALRQPVSRLNWRKPVGITEWRLTRALPEELKGSLPTIEEIEAELIGRIEAAGGEN
jgi:predicted nuclease of restriction endonuclease-like (RecB) superfamily